MVAVVISFLFCVMSLVWKNLPSSESLQRFPVSVSKGTAETHL